MASTKIINVLKDDKFEEILDLFRDTPAKEVIFVLPKTSRAFKNEEHFVILDNEAKKYGKKISLLCSSFETNRLAKKYNFDVLLAKGENEKPSLITAVNQFSRQPKDKDEGETSDGNELEEPDEEEEGDTDEEETDEADFLKNENKENEEYEVVTASKIKQGLEGIVRGGVGSRLNVSPEKERPVRLDVKKASRAEMGEIQSVWESMPGSGKKEKNLWADLGLHSERRKWPWLGKPFSTRGGFAFGGKNFSKKSVIVLGVISILLLGTIIYTSTGSAKINITPKKQSLETDLKISASDKFSSVDQTLNKIPGQLFSIDKTASQTFPATGEKDVAQKARGKITVYNAYGTTPQVLIATTRFEKDGFIFRTLKTITVPGTTVVNGQISPGTVDVEVVADKAGETYNISAGKFTIPAFQERADTGRYEKIYGQSVAPMNGGMIGRAKVVTQSDYSDAKETLLDQLKKNIDDTLKAQTAGLKTIDSLSIKIGEPESSAKVDEAADNFTMSIQGLLKTIGFKESDLLGLIKQNIDKNRNLYVIPEKLQLNYRSVNFRDTDNILEFTVDITGIAYAKIDIDKIKNELVGKDEEEIKSYFRGVEGIESVKIKLSPFWVKRIPDKPDKILIDLTY